MPVAVRTDLQVFEDLRLVPLAGGMWAVSATVLAFQPSIFLRWGIMIILILLSCVLLIWQWKKRVPRGKRHTTPSGSIRLTIAIFLALMCAMILRSGYALERFNADPFHLLIKNPKVVTCTFRVEAEARVNSFGGARAPASGLSCRGLPSSFGGKVMLSGKAVATFQRGEKVTVRGIPRSDRFLRPPFVGRFQIRRVVDRAPDGWWVERAHASRAYLWNALTMVPPQSGALIAGISLGDKNGFSKEELTRFQRASFSHLIAVSGLHTGIIVAAAGMVIPGRGVVKLALTTLLFGVIMLIVGPTPSVVRACLMGFVAVIAIVSGRGQHSGVALSIAVMSMLVWDPWDALSLGFALSVSATAGVIWPARWALSRGTQRARLGGESRREKVLRRAWEAGVVSFWAQVCIVPVSAMSGLPVSPWGVVSNLLIVPVLLPLCLGSVMVLILAQISMLCAACVALLLMPLAQWVWAVAQVSSTLPWADVVLPPWQGSVLFLVLVGGGYASTVLRARRRIGASLLIK